MLRTLLEAEMGKASARAAQLTLMECILELTQYNKGPCSGFPLIPGPCIHFPHFGNINLDQVPPAVPEVLKGGVWSMSWFFQPVALACGYVV